MSSGQEVTPCEVCGETGRHAPLCLRGGSEQEVKPADLPEDLGGYDIDDEYEPEDEDPGDECGRWDNGRLGRFCSLAGTEFCDFECPYRDGDGEDE